MLRRYVFLILICLTLTGPALVAEEQPKAPPEFKFAPKPEDEIAHKIAVARRMIRERDFQGAAALLELSYDRHKDNTVVINLLRQCYNQLGQYGKTEMLVRRLIEKAPDNITFRTYLAEAQARQGLREEAARTYDTAVSLCPPGDTMQYLNIVRSMQSHAFELHAIELIDSLRRALDNPALFAFEAGTIQEIQRQYRLAAREFLVAAADTSRTGAQAENKLLSLLQFEESSAEVEAYLLEKVQTEPDPLVAEVLSNFYLDSDRDEQAFDYVLLRDSLEGGTGMPLVQYMNTCRNRKLYAQTARVGEYILRHYDELAQRTDAFFTYADALVHLGRFREAIAVYDSALNKFPRQQDKAEAAYRIGDIYLNYLLDYRVAMRIFDSVVNNYQAGNGYMKTLLTIPHCYIRLGMLDSALAGFEHLKRRRLTNDGKEEVDFYVSLVRFFKNEYDSSRAGFNRLLVEYPQGFFVNDALRLLLVMNQAGEEVDLLDRLSQALLYEHRLLYDSSKQALEEIASDSGAVLGDVALFKLAQLSLQQFDSTAALEYVNRLSVNHPESYYLPYGLKIKADMFVTDPLHLAEGKEVYRHLLETYPNYPFISEVRKKLRELELDSQTG